MMDNAESPFMNVKEEEVQGDIFQVTHRILQIPRSTYLEVLHDQEEPFSEAGAQKFVEAYLRWSGEKEGVIGMVRFDEENERILLDAAIRYRISATDRPSCYS